MFNRSEILKAAWAQVKGWYSARCRAFKFVKADFQWALRCAWRDARMALLTETERRIDHIEGILAQMPFGSYSQRDQQAERDLRAELASLKA